MQDRAQLELIEMIALFVAKTFLEICRPSLFLRETKSFEGEDANRRLSCLSSRDKTFTKKVSLKTWNATEYAHLKTKV